MWLQEPKFQFQSWEKMMKCIMVNRLQECYCQLKICKIFGFAFSISSTWYFQPTRCLCSQKLENVYFRFMQKSSVFILAEQVVVSIKFQSEEFVKKFLFFFWNLEVVSWIKITRILYRDVLFEYHLKFWNTASISIPARSLL